jgi:adenylate kinase family enzyme
MTVPNRIHIIGSTGSGKTYLAEALSKKLNVPYGELDTIMWSGRTELAGKNDPEVRDKLLQQIIDQDRWIVEGVYYKWLTKSFERAEVIIILDTHLLIRDFRIICRFIKQKLQIERSTYKQSINGLAKMINWNHEFEKKYKRDIMDFLEPF